MTVHEVAAYVVENGLLGFFVGVWFYEPLLTAIKRRSPYIGRRATTWLAINAVLLAIAWRIVGA